MIPKEKAIELIDKFQELNRSKISDYSRIEFPTAKQCALIAVDEILDALDKSLIDADIEWFKQVKEEIEKL
jgi:hypothetical protein